MESPTNQFAACLAGADAQGEPTLHFQSNHQSLDLRSLRRETRPRKLQSCRSWPPASTEIRKKNRDQSFLVHDMAIRDEPRKSLIKHKTRNAQSATMIRTRAASPYEKLQFSSESSGMASIFGLDLRPSCSRTWHVGHWHAPPSPHV